MFNSILANTFKNMTKTRLLPILLITLFLGACGFHSPHKNPSLNAVIKTSTPNLFADVLKKHLNSDALPSVLLEIGDEIRTQRGSAYDSQGQVSNYELSLSVAVKILSNERKLLSSNTLTASIYLNRIIATQADRLQLSQGYEQLRKRLIKQLLRKLNRLNEN